MIATVAAFRFVPQSARAILARYELPTSAEATRGDADRHVALQPWLDVLREIAATVGASKLREVGASMIVNALFPPQFADVPSVLMALDAIYRMNHTGDVGRYVATQEATRIRIDCETPFPRVFERGLIEGICRNRSLMKGKRYDVLYVEGPPKGDRTCSLYITEV